MKPRWKKSTRKCPQCNNRKTEKQIGVRGIYRCPSCGFRFG